MDAAYDRMDKRLSSGRGATAQDLDSVYIWFNTSLTSAKLAANARRMGVVGKDGIARFSYDPPAAGKIPIPTKNASHIPRRKARNPTLTPNLSFSVNSASRSLDRSLWALMDDVYKSTGNGAVFRIPYRPAGRRRCFDYRKVGWASAAGSYMSVYTTSGGFNTASKVTVVAFRGSNDIVDWVRNFQVWGTQCNLNGFDCGSVHQGFWNAYRAGNGHIAYWVNDLVNDVTNNQHLVFTGHSQGAAVAAIAAMDVASAADHDNYAYDTLTYVGFGTPALDRGGFGDYWEELRNGGWVNRATRYNNLSPSNRLDLAARASWLPGMEFFPSVGRNWIDMKVTRAQYDRIPFSAMCFGLRLLFWFSGGGWDQSCYVHGRAVYGTTLERRESIKNLRC